MIKTIAPVNIALIKYWGKASLNPVRPSTPSISLTLKEFYTETEITKSDTFSMVLNGSPVDEAFLEKTEAFIRLFQPEGPIQLSINSTNHVPTAAGLASSASGFAALSLALHHFYQKPLDTLEKITALGSGSAIRSLQGGAVMWHLDGHIEALNIDLSSYQMAVVMIDTSKKKISSREAMKIVQASPSYPDWIYRNTARAHLMKKALMQADFETMGTLMEESTLDMHSLGALSNTPFVYLQQTTLMIWDALVQARKSGLKAYATADAGPNLKILFKKDDVEAIHAFLRPFNVDYVISDFTDQGARVWS